MEDAAFNELKMTGKLPTPSGVALQVVELSRKESVTLQEIARVVQADPALSGRLIKFANSALVGPRRPTVAVTDAIRLLGVNVVRQLCLGFSVLSQNRVGACKAFDYGQFWTRSLATGIAANALCLRTRTAAADEAFTCGLLARVGTLALATLYPDAYSDLISANASADNARMIAVEREKFRTDHEELCAALLEDWQLPRIFVTAVFHHRDPQAAGFPEGSREAVLCHLVHVASKIGQYCIVSDAERRLLTQDLIFLAARIGIDADAIALLTDQVVAEWKDWGRILEVKTADLPTFAALASVPVETPTISEAPNPAPAIPKSTEPIERLRILVVDDDPATLLLLKHMLTNEGHEVFAAQDGNDAMKLAIKERPQLIVCDWIMPEMDGLELCRALRATEEGKQMYFLLLTGMEKDDHLVEAFEAGVDDYVVKPFSPRVLAARLRAGQRVIRLQEEALRDSQSLRRFATELAVANRRLRQAALTDPLTGLPNRRYAMERMEQEWAASLRNQRPLTVMMIDIDRFKVVNDMYGHDMGDALLRNVALTLRKAARAEDVICRLGGEEFLVISPNTPMTQALRLAERLRVAIAESQFSVGSIHHSVTVSIGVAERGPVMSQFEEMLKAADQVLYHSKHLGGNRTHAPQDGASPAAQKPDSK